MKFFIDTADVKERREGASTGLVDGVPTFLADGAKVRT
jgi:hypothetical protein